MWGGVASVSPAESSLVIMANVICTKTTMSRGLKRYDNNKNIGGKDIAIIH